MTGSLDCNLKDFDTIKFEMSHCMRTIFEALPRLGACFVMAAGFLIAAPLFAQMEFSGEWAPVQDEDNTGNPYTGEFVGIPMSRAALLRAQAWNASLYTLPEWQCRPHG